MLITVYNTRPKLDIKIVIFFNLNTQFSLSEIHQFQLQAGPYCYPDRRCAGSDFSVRLFAFCLICFYSFYKYIHVNTVQSCSRSLHRAGIQYDDCFNVYSASQRARNYNIAFLAFSILVEMKKKFLGKIQFSLLPCIIRTPNYRPKFEEKNAYYIRKNTVSPTFLGCYILLKI